MQGRELTQFVTDIIWYLRNLLLIKTSDSKMEDVIDVSSDNLQRLKEEAETLEAQEIMRYIRIFSELSGQMKYAAQKRILIEMTVIKLCRPAMETSNDAMAARVRDLEEKLENGIVSTAPVVQTVRTEAAPQAEMELPKAIPDDIRRIVGSWRSIVANAEQPMRSYLKSARLSLGGDNRLIIVVGEGLAYDSLRIPDNQKTVENMISNFLQKEVSVQIECVADGQRFEDSYVDLSKVINMDIEYVDD